MSRRLVLTDLELRVLSRAMNEITAAEGPVSASMLRMRICEGGLRDQRAFNSAKRKLDAMALAPDVEAAHA